MTMRAPVKPLVPELRKEAAAAVEAFAQAELKPDVVRVRMYEVARQGQTALRLRLPCPVDMRRTAAAKVFADWCRDNGLRLDWLKRTLDLPDGRQVDVFEPEITW